MSLLIFIEKFDKKGYKKVGERVKFMVGGWGGTGRPMLAGGAGIVGLGTNSAATIFKQNGRVQVG